MHLFYVYLNNATFYFNKNYVNTYFSLNVYFTSSTKKLSSLNLIITRDNQYFKTQKKYI